MYAGADFIKTSTGKISEGATYKSVYVMLNAIKDFNKIQDLSMENGIQILKNILYNLNEKDLKTLVACSLFYPPKARAFLGALLEIIGSDVGLDTLKKSLNPLSYYYIRIEQKFLPSKENWHIK